MSKVSYKNRGLKFEKMIKNKCEELKEKGIASISKVPTEWQVIRNGNRIVSAFPVSKSKFVDFIGVSQGKAIAIEAKETHEKTRFPFGNIHKEQIDYLDTWLGLGGKGYYLIRFSAYDEVFLIEASVMHNCINNIGRKSAPYEWFKETKEVVELDRDLDFISYINKIN